MVTGNNSHIGFALRKSQDRVDNLVTKRVRKSERSNHAQVVLNVLAALLVFEVAVLELHVLKLFSCEVSVCDGDSLKTAKWFLFSIFNLHFGFIGHDQIVLDNVDEVLLSFVGLAIKRSLLGKAIKLGAAERHNLFGSALDDEAHMVWVVFEGVGHGHSFAVRAEGDPQLKDVVALALNKFLLHADARVEEKV